MVEKGRNFVSSSLDGTVILWDCGSGSSVHTFKRKESLNDGVTSVHITESIGEEAKTSLQKSTSTGEFGTENKLLLAGHISGVISIFDMYTKDELISLPAIGGTVESISTLRDEPNHIIAAYSNGLIATWDIKSPSEPLLACAVPGKSINKATFDKGEGLISNEVGVFQFKCSNKLLSVVTNGDGSTDLRIGNKLYVITEYGDILVYNKNQLTKNK